MLDLWTLEWSLIFPPQGDVALEDLVSPEPRYFHTANNYRNELIIVFGGLGRPASEPGETECCLDDMCIFDLKSRLWRIPKATQGMEVPGKRYAHIATINRDRLVIAGGEFRNPGAKIPENLYDLHVFDIPTEKWVHKRVLGVGDDHIGYYRSVMATTPYNPTTYPLSNREEEDRLLDTADALYRQIPASKLASEPSSPTTSFRSRSGSLETPQDDRRPSRGNLNAIPETEGTDTEPFIYIYSTRQRPNRQFTRHLLKIQSPQSDSFTIEDHSKLLPPQPGLSNLRFPVGDIIGDWLLFSGTIPNEKPRDAGRPPNSQEPLKPASFNVLALHLPTKQIKIVDVGTVFLTGSWNRGVIWPQCNSVVVFGNIEGDMTADYKLRRANYKDIIFVDLEVFGIYKPPKLVIPSFARDFALNVLSRREFSDMDIVTKDNFRIHVNSRVLVHRWPMFTEVLNTCIYGNLYTGEETGRRRSGASTIVPLNQQPIIPATERPRVLYLPLKQEHAYAFLSYIYTDTLPDDVDVATLCALLMMSKRYAPGLERLATLTADALHNQLNDESAWPTIEAAAFSGKTGLQVQAMLTMRTAAELKLQAHRRRLELKNKESMQALRNGDTNGNGTGNKGEEGDGSAAESNGLGSRGSNQSGDDSSVIPTPAESRLG